MKRGGYRLRWDIILGLAGSAVGSLVFWAHGVSPGEGLVLVAGFAFVVAAIAIVAQRKIWATTTSKRATKGEVPFAC
jgi:drug/metabolite transporter (DMT)-like permease